MKGFDEDFHLKGEVFQRVLIKSFQSPSSVPRLMQSFRRALVKPAQGDCPHHFEVAVAPPVSGAQSGKTWGQG